MLSALASGVPVIASDTPALREFVEDGRNGALFPLGDVEALAAIFRRLAGSPGLFNQWRAGAAFTRISTRK